MWEFQGPAFERVFAYGEILANDIPPLSRERAIYNHVKEWVRSQTVPRSLNEVYHRVQIEWIKEGERIVGVKAYV